METLDFPPKKSLKIQPNSSRDKALFCAVLLSLLDDWLHLGQIHLSSCANVMTRSHEHLPKDLKPSFNQGNCQCWRYGGCMQRISRVHTAYKLILVVRKDPIPARDSKPAVSSFMFIWLKVYPRSFRPIAEVGQVPKKWQARFLVHKKTRRGKGMNVWARSIRKNL